MCIRDRPSSQRASPCAAEPKASPLATRLLTWQRSRMAGPTIPPKSPQPNTITAVSDGMPFECSDKEIAMGMVTDLGCSDEVIASSTPMILQIAMMKKFHFVCSFIHK